MLTIDAYNVSAGQYFVFDGSAETNGGFLFYGGSATTTVIGGAQNDNFASATAAPTSCTAAAAATSLISAATLNTARPDRRRRGDDVLYLSGGYTPADPRLLVRQQHRDRRAAERLRLQPRGRRLVRGRRGERLYLRLGHFAAPATCLFNGAAELDGTFSFIDSINNDFIAGSQNDDRFDTYMGG